MVRLNCPHHQSQKKPSLRAKASQHSCSRKDKFFILFSNQNLRLGNPLRLARLDTCWVDRKKKKAFTQRNQKRDFLAVQNPPKEHFHLYHREPTKTLKIHSPHHVPHKGNGCVLKALFVWLHLMWLFLKVNLSSCGAVIH